MLAVRGIGGGTPCDKKDATVMLFYGVGWREHLAGLHKGGTGQSLRRAS